jgi:hypothetical protein
MLNFYKQTLFVLFFLAGTVGSLFAQEFLGVMNDNYRQSCNLPPLSTAVSK